MQKLISPKYSVIDLEWFFQNRRLDSVFEISLVTYDDNEFSTLVRPSVNLEKNWQLKGRLKAFGIDSEKFYNIKNANKSPIATFNDLRLFLSKSDITVIYSYGKSDIEIIEDYIFAIDPSATAHTFFRNSNKEFIRIIDVQSILFYNNFSMSVANTYNVLFDDNEMHTFSSIEDCKQTKYVLDFIIDNNMTKKSFIEHINKKLITLVDMKHIAFNDALLKVLYPAYNKTIKEKNQV